MPAKRVWSRKSNPLLLTCDSLNALMAGQYHRDLIEAAPYEGTNRVATTSGTGFLPKAGFSSFECTFPMTINPDEIREVFTLF